MTNFQAVYYPRRCARGTCLRLHRQAASRPGVLDSQIDRLNKTEQRLEPFEQLARIVITHRARLGLSQQELAERMGTTASAVSRIESGDHGVSIGTVRKLAAAFEIRAVVGFEYEADDTRQHELVAL